MRLCAFIILMLADGNMSGFLEMPFYGAQVSEQEKAVFVLLIPDNAGGMIIGKGGAVISGIR